MTVVMSTGGQPSQQSSQSHPNQPQSQSEQTQQISQPIDPETGQQSTPVSDSVPQMSNKLIGTPLSAKNGRKTNKSTKTSSENNLNSDNSEEISHISNTSHHKSNESINTSEDMITDCAVSTDCEEIETRQELAEDEEPEFPIHELNKLDDMINKPRWVIPVLPKGELEVLLDATIRLCKQGYDVRSEPCQRFIREGLTTSFTKILTDEAVNGWKFEIHVRLDSKKCLLKDMTFHSIFVSNDY